MQNSIPKILMLVIISAATCAASPKSGDARVHLKLLADVSSIEAGKPFTIGVHFKIDSGWHIYWTNPGDAGLPTTVAFNLPAGFTVEQLKFPVPERIVDPGDIVCYGYEDEVMLLATVTPPRDLQIGAPIKISADANWLVCEDVCLPGTGSAEIALPVAMKSSPANVEQFKSWTDQLPIPAENLAGAKVKSSGPIDLSKGETTVDVTSSLKFDQLIPGVLDGATVMIGKPKSERSGNVATVRVAPLPGEVISAKFLEVLIVFNSDGVRRAYDLRIPVVNPPAGKSK